MNVMSQSVFANYLEIRIPFPTDPLFWDPRLVYENKGTPYSSQTLLWHWSDCGYQEKKDERTHIALYLSFCKRVFVPSHPHSYSTPPTPTHTGLSPPAFPTCSVLCIQSELSQKINCRSSTSQRCLPSSERTLLNINSLWWTGLQVTVKSVESSQGWGRKGEK